MAPVSVSVSVSGGEQGGGDSDNNNNDNNKNGSSSSTSGTHHLHHHEQQEKQQRPEALLHTTTTTTTKNFLLHKIWIVALGSRGDVQPYLAVGVALVRRGYHVTFLTNNSYAKMAQHHNFGIHRGVPLCDDFETSLKTNQELSEAMMEGNVMRCFAGISKTHQQNAPSVCDAFLKEIESHGVPDLCLAMPFGHYVAWYLFFTHNVPCYELTTFPVSYNPHHMILNMPNNLPFGLGHYLLHSIVMGMAYDGYQVYDEYTKANILTKVPKANMIQHYKHPQVPIAALLSPEIGNVLYSSEKISPMIRFVGTTVLNTKQQLQQVTTPASATNTTTNKFGSDSVMQSINEFLKDDGFGDPPPSTPTIRKPKPPAVVYFGWGSMVTVSPEYMVLWCLRAVRHAKLRAIICGGNAILSFEVLERAIKTKSAATCDTDHDDDGSDLLEYAKTNVLFVPACPHEWLFPRVTVTVHHGGAGTTTAALRSGNPTIVTPVFGDQYDFSYVVRELNVGIGFEKQLQHISWEELGDALIRVVSDKQMKKRASELGTKLRAEDGANKTVDEMERFWREFCVTGRYMKEFPAENSTMEEKNKRRRRHVYTAIIIGSLATITATVIARRRKL